MQGKPSTCQISRERKYVDYSMVRTAKESPDNFCRICKTDFRTYLGNFNKIIHSSTQNLFKASQRKESFGVVLSDVCENVGVPLARTNAHSTKVCRSCSRKILKVNELLSELKSSINVTHQKFSNNLESGVKATTEKRKLLTPDRGDSPANRKSFRFKSPVHKKDGSKSSAKRKCLFEDTAKENSDKENVDAENLCSIVIDDMTASNAESEITSDEVFSNLNVDGLKTCDGGRSSLQMKVVLVHPNGNVVVRNPTNEKTVQIIRNIVDGGWTAVANGVFDHKEEELQEELRLALKRKINKEFKFFSKTDSALKGTQPEELAAFSNKLVVTEVRAHCPFWYASLTGAAGVRDNTSSINELALATAVVARTRNPTMSAVSYRISNLLTHSGARFQDITRLSKLGVCMSPNSTIAIQRKMGKYFDAKVLKWKCTIEDNKNSLKFLKEILLIQKVSLEEDSMDLEVEFDLREDSVKHYTSYSQNVYNKVKSSLEKNPSYSCIAVGSCPEEAILEEIHRLEGEKLPLYK